MEKTEHRPFPVGAVHKASVTTKLGLSGLGLELG